jgi:hypothetical protein
MIWGGVLLLAAALIGIPLSVALTAITAVLGVVTGLLVHLYRSSYAIGSPVVSLGYETTSFYSTFE